MKKIKLTESMLTNLIEKVISERKQLKEQKSAFNWSNPEDSWRTQLDAREKGKYCKEPRGKVRHYEGQQCNVETNWYDWESTTGVKTQGISSMGRWKCGVGCIVRTSEGKMG